MAFLSSTDAPRQREAAAASRGDRRAAVAAAPATSCYRAYGLESRRGAAL